MKTGRTSRLLEDPARRASVDGRRVYVIGVDRKHAELLFSLFRERFPGGELRSQQETAVRYGPGAVRFLPSAVLDWQDLRVRGQHPDTVVLVDHYAIEYHFQALLRMLHRYDLAPVLRAVPPTRRANMPDPERL